MTSRLAAGLLALLLAGCAATPDSPATLRQALFGLGERAAERVIAAPHLPHPPADQVVLLAAPEVDPELGVDRERLRESLTRALLGLPDGPQVLNWNATTVEGGGANQWRLECRLVADGPHLRLSDRELLPYRLSMVLRRAGSSEALWSSELRGALDVSAL